MITIKAKPLIIINGPSKMDLVTALAYAYASKNSGCGPCTVDLYLMDGETGLPLVAKNAHCAPTYTAATCVPIKAKITGLEHEDGSGESFLIKGYLAYGPKPTGQSFGEEFSQYYSSLMTNKVECFTPFSGAYSSRKRQGEIYLESRSDEETSEKETEVATPVS